MTESGSPQILIIQTAFIGDVILATSLIKTLKQEIPDATIDFLVRKGNEGLLQNNPDLREVIVFNKSRKYRNLIRLIRQVRATGYDQVINAQRFLTTGLITAFSRAKEKSGFRKNPMSGFFNHIAEHEIDPGLGTHEIHRNHELIRHLVTGEPARPALYPGIADYSAIREWEDSRFITIAPASVWYTKQFPKEKWIEFINRIDPGLQVLLIGSPDDNALCEDIQTTSSHGNIKNLAGELTLLQSAALMTRALMNYSNDSAPLHLASATNSKVCAVFCSTVPGFGFGPLSEESYVVEVKENLDCRPCGLHGFRKCPKAHFNCARQIEVEQLLAVLEKAVRD